MQLIQRPIQIALLLLLAGPICADDVAHDFGHSLLADLTESGDDNGTPIKTISFGADSDVKAATTEEIPLTKYKQGAIQKATVTGGWLSSLKSNSLSTTYIEVSLTSGIPLGSFDNILGITPFFRTDFLNAPPNIDVPSELFETGVSFFLTRKMSDRWSAMAIFAPTIRSDFTTSEQALRFFGLGLLTWQAVPDRVGLSFGALFLGRADLPVLPAVGLKYTPTPCTTYDLRFPESRISWRLAKDGGKSESWLYVSGGFGGNTWAITRNDRSSDLMTLSYLRLLFGAEHLLDGGGRMFIESGWAFNRKLKYDSDQSAERSFANAVIFQGGLSY